MMDCHEPDPYSQQPICHCGRTQSRDNEADNGDNCCHTQQPQQEDTAVFFPLNFFNVINIALFIYLFIYSLPAADMPPSWLLQFYQVMTIQIESWKMGETSLVIVPPYTYIYTICVCVCVNGLWLLASFSPLGRVLLLLDVFLNRETSVKVPRLKLLKRKTQAAVFWSPPSLIPLLQNASLVTTEFQTPFNKRSKQNRLALSGRVWLFKTTGIPA